MQIPTEPVTLDKQIEKANSEVMAILTSGQKHKPAFLAKAVTTLETLADL